MILQWLTSAEWTHIVKALLHTLWQGAVIAVGLGFTLRQLGNPVARYRLSLAALGGVMFAGLITWAVLNRPLSQSIFKSPASQTQPAVTPVADNILPPLVVNLPPAEPKSATTSWSAWLAMLWLAGSTAMIFRAGCQVAGAERLRRSAQPLEDARIAGLLDDARRVVGLARRVRIAVTDKLTSPAVVGVLVPTLILPLSLTTTLTPEQIRFILLHELAHIRRGDYLAGLFQLFAEALLFFNPAVWWISRQMRIEREACCDTLAVELSGAPVDYARTLVCVAENVLSPAPAAALAFGDERGPSSLTDRVQRMLVPGYRPALRLTWRAMLLALLVGGGLLFLSALGTSVTVAAILSPQERIERIEKKMIELGEKPEPENFYSNDANAPLVKLSGRVRTADGTPVPKWVWLNLNSAVKHSSTGTAIMARNGFFTNSVRAGSILIGAVVTNFAPAVIGPLDGLATNRFENLGIVLQRGFDVPLQLVDADNGQPLSEARVATMYWMGNNGFQAHAWKSGADGYITLTHCADLPMDVTANVPGYEIIRKRFDQIRAGKPLRLELRRGVIESGVVLDKATGQPVAGAEVHLLNQPDVGNFPWDDSLHLLGKTDASGAFTLNQLRQKAHVFLGISAPGHESVILEHISGAKNNLVVRLGPELIVRGHVIGSLDGLQIIDKDTCLSRDFSDVFGGASNGYQEWVRLHVTNGVATFQFTNRSAGPVTLTSETGYREERAVMVPIADWVVNLSEARKTEAKFVPKREVIFRFQHPSGVPPCGTVAVQIPDNLEINHLTAHEQEMQITNGEVRAQIAIGGRTSIEPKHMVGYWFNRGANWTALTGESGSLFSIEVRSNAGPLVIEIPLIPAGAIYAQARNADGTLAGGLFFGVSELKRAPGRDRNSLDTGGDNFSSQAPRTWVSGPLPLGGKYQIHAWRGNAFCVSGPVKLTEANPDAAVELQFLPGKIFTGVVLDADGQPVRDVGLKVAFKLSDEHNFGLQSVATDQRGCFHLENLTPELGEYSVEPDVPGLMDECVKLDFASQPQTIRLQHGRTLGGRVVEVGTGYPIPGMEIRALDYEQNKLPMLTTHTDADGRFAFTTLGDVNYTLYPDGGELLGRPRSGNQKFRADGNTNLTLTVKLYGWSQLKPKAPVAMVGSTNVTGVLADPNFRAALHELQQRNGVESLPEPEVTTTSSGRGINRITMSNITVSLSNAYSATSSPSAATSDSRVKAGSLVQDGKLLYEMGKFDEAEIKLTAALALDAENAAAKYYLGLVQTARQNPKLSQIKSGRQQIVEKLGGIRLPRVSFENLSLADAVRQLNEAARQNDPEKTGVKIVTATNAVSSQLADINSVVVKLTLAEVRLADVLDALVLVANKPIKYSILDDGIVFSVRSTADDVKLFTRTFRVDKNVFHSGLMRMAGTKTGLGNIAKASDTISVAARKLFSSLGVNLESPPGKSVFFNDKNDLLLVRATAADLDTIERAMQEINRIEPQIHIKSRFYEVPEKMAGGLETIPGVTNGVTVVLSPDNALSLMKMLQSLRGAENLAEPEVTTTSGRQTKMMATQVITIVTNLAYQEIPTRKVTTNHLAHGMIILATNISWVGSISPQTSKLEYGPVLDEVPYVLSDRTKIVLNTTASDLKFFGYVAPHKNFFGYQYPSTNVANWVSTSAGDKITLPDILPVTQPNHVSAQVTVADGETLVLFPKPDAEPDPRRARHIAQAEKKNGRKIMVVLVTAEIVDPAGNRVRLEQ